MADTVSEPLVRRSFDTARLVRDFPSRIENRNKQAVADVACPLGKVHLPFEGDATLSIILSKAFMLAEDDKIKDKTILSQIKERRF